MANFWLQTIFENELDNMFHELNMSYLAWRNNFAAGSRRSGRIPFRRRSSLSVGSGSPVQLLLGLEGHGPGLLGGSEAEDLLPRRHRVVHQLGRFPKQNTFVFLNKKYQDPGIGIYLLLWIRFLSFQFHHLTF